MEMKFCLVYLWCTLVGHWSTLITAAHEEWTPFNVDRVLSVTRGGELDLRKAISLRRSEAVTEDCIVQFVATDVCGQVRPSRFSCNRQSGSILYQHLGCLAKRELATFIVSSPVETPSANVSIFSVEIMIEAPPAPTSEITLEQLESDLSASVLDDAESYNYKIVFPAELIGTCHYEVVTDWPGLPLPVSGTVMGVVNQPLPCGFMDSKGLTYIPRNFSSISQLAEDYLLIKVHFYEKRVQNRFIVLPLDLRGLENNSNSSAVEVLPTQEVVIHQGTNTPISLSLLTFTRSSSLQLNNFQSLYRFTFPILSAGSFRSSLASVVNTTHTTFTNRDLLKGSVTFYPSFSAPERTLFQYTIANLAGVVVAMGDVNVCVRGHRWEWPVQRTNRPLKVWQGASSILDQRVFDFYLQTDLCIQRATMTVLVPPVHGHLTFINGSDVDGTSILISAVKNGTVLVYSHSNTSEGLTDSIIWEVRCPGGPALQVFTSVLIAPGDDTPDRILRGGDIKVHRSWATPISPSSVITFDLDSSLDDISVSLSDEGQVVTFDPTKLNIKEKSYLFPFVDTKHLRTQKIIKEVSHFSLSELEDYKVWYVPPSNLSVTRELLNFSVGDSMDTVAVDIFDLSLNQSLHLTTLEERPCVHLNKPLPLHTRTGTYITSSYLYSQAPQYSPDQVVYRITSPPSKGLLCLLSGEKCQSSVDQFTQRDINTQHVYYEPDVGEEGIKEDSFEFKVMIDEFQQHTITLHQFYFKPVEERVKVATDRTFYVTVGGSKAIAPRHFRPYSQYFNTRDLVFEITRRPHYGHLELRGQPNPSNFSFDDLLGTRELVYRHLVSASEACSDHFSFSVGNTTHLLDGTMTIAIRHGRENVDVRVDVGHHTLFSDQRKFVFGSEDISVSSSFCLDFVTFTLTSLPSFGVLSLVDNEHNTIIQLKENSTFTANDIYSGFLHYTFTHLMQVRNQTLDKFALNASDPISKWTVINDRTGLTTRHFQVIIIPSPNIKHELAIDITSPGFLTWLPSYERYGYIFSENDITIFNSTIEERQVVIQIDREPEFGTIWKSNSMDNIFTVEDVNNGLVWYRSDVRLDGFLSDSFQMSIIVNLINFSMLVQRDEFVINWATVQLKDNSLRVTESNGRVEIIVRRSGELWFESQVQLTTVAESALTNTGCRPPADFCNLTQTLIFPINVTETSVIVEINDDDIAEDTETFTVMLTEPTNAVIDETRNHTKIWITDTEDYSVITMLGDNSTNSECTYVTRVEERDNKATITLQRTGNLGQRVGVICYTGAQSNNARANQLSDYVPRHRDQPNSTVWFEMNQEVATCEIEIIDDHQAEYVERFYVKLDEETLGRAVVSQPRAVHCVEISNDRDDWPQVNFTQLEVVARESNASDVLFPISVLRTGPDLSQETTVRLQWLLQSRDEAEFDADFSLPQNESCFDDSNLTCITFAAGERRAVFHVIIKHDNRLETNESFHVILHSAFKVYPDIIKVVIMEGYLPAVVKFSQPVNRFNETIAFGFVPIVRSGFLNSSVTVYYRLKGAPDNGNATPGISDSQPGVDFLTSRTPNRAEFSPGETHQNCRLYIINDNVWEGPESLTIVLEIGDESIGAELPEELSHTQVIIDDPEDIPTIQFREEYREVQEPLSNFDIDKTVVPLTLTRSGDLSYSTAVRYQMSHCNPSTPTASDLDHELVFYPYEEEKQIEIELMADRHNNSDKSMIIMLCSSRVLNESNVPVRIGSFNQTKINVTNREDAGPFFPQLPTVESEGADAGNFYYDQPLLCITPCTSCSVSGFVRLSCLKQACDSESISPADTVYSWQTSEDGINFTTLDHRTALTNTHSNQLDTFYLKPNLYVRCSAQAVSHTGVRGHTRTSVAVLLDRKKYYCEGEGRGSSEVELTSYSSFSGHDKDLLRLSVRVPHRPNSIPVLSSHPIRNTTNTFSHVCSTLISEGRFSWLSKELFYSHLDREECMWEFTKWLPVINWTEQCGGWRSEDEGTAVNIKVYSGYEQYGSTLVIQQSTITRQINYSTTVSTAFLPSPLHVLSLNGHSDAYVYPVAVEEKSAVLQIYLYSVLPLGTDGETYTPSNSTSLVLLYTDYTTANTSKQAWRLDVSRNTSDEIPLEFHLTCQMQCDSIDEALTFPLAISSSERGMYKPALRASVTLRHSPEAFGNYTGTFTLGDRVYIVFELDPAVEIQDGFTFVVSELHLCSRTTAVRNCSNQHTIVTGVAQETSSFDVRLEMKEHTAILQLSTSSINVVSNEVGLISLVTLHTDNGMPAATIVNLQLSKGMLIFSLQEQPTSLWYFDLSYGISDHHEVVVKEHTILNISFEDPSPPTTSAVVGATDASPTSKLFLYAAIAILLVAMVIVGVGFSVIGILVFTSRMRAKLQKRVQSQLEAQRLSGSRKNSMALNNKKRDRAPAGGVEEQQTLRRSQSTIGFPTREKLKRVKTKRSTRTPSGTESNIQGIRSSEVGASARPVTVDEGASVQPSCLSSPGGCSGMSRARSLPNLAILETRTNGGFFMGEPQPRKLHFQTTVSKVNTERWHLNKWAQHHIKANRQLETARTIHDLATRRRNYGANEKNQNASLNKESHSELARYAVRSLAASAKTPEPEKGPRTKL